MEKTYQDITRIEAYDGNILNKYNDIVIPNNTNASIYEIGCTFSHIKAIITAYNNNDDGAIILHCINTNEINIMINMKEDYSPWNRSRWSTGAYYISKKGIDKFYNLFYKNGIIDINNSCFEVADVFIYKNLISYNYTKPLFIHQIKESTIHQAHIHTCHTPAYKAIKKYFDNIKISK